MPETASESRPAWPWRRSLLLGFVMGSVYLIAFRSISWLPPFARARQGGAILMSFSFLVLGPFITGALTMQQPPSRPSYSGTQLFLVPWLVIVLNLLVALNVHWEGLICAVFILPPALLFAGLGGLLSGFLHRRLRRQQGITLSCLAILPLLLAMVETTLHQPLEVRTVHTGIRIHASAATIWRNIERVPAIAPSELRASWANTIGFPRPVEATLSHEGVGGVRQASFERGLSFTETVTDWQPGQRIAFTIVANTASIPPTTLDEHVTVGGRFFDVLTGEYRLEPLPDGDTFLHLSSRERLSTDFNPYAALWSDAVMRDMQGNILHVVRARCEREAATR